MKKFIEPPCFSGSLGAIYSPEQTIFRLWAPAVNKAELNLYIKSKGSSAGDKSGIPMTLAGGGVWETVISHNLLNPSDTDIGGTYYTFTVHRGGSVYEVMDPYAKGAGAHDVSGNIQQRGMVVDFKKANPPDWDNQAKPEISGYTDRIIYELHTRDFSIDTSSGVTGLNRGKFLALTEKGTKNPDGLSTCLDHLIELGVTDVHILPLFDFASVDEISGEAQFNWGYDPLNYNVPEGSYSSDPADGYVRITELKQMIMSLHNSGIRVIMDVVYNHTAKSADSHFNRINPGYYYRTDNEGNFSDGSGCGNETASERVMYRKFIIDSVCFWAQEYKIDGFRFDLMGVHDIDTMNELYRALQKINGNIFVYGEGWTCSKSALDIKASALKVNAAKMPGIAVFNDNARDAIKGSVFEAEDTGFISGKAGAEKAVCRGVIAQTACKGLKSTLKTAWAGSPEQVINYVSCHDNLTFHDKIAVSYGYSAQTPQGLQVNKLGMSIVMTMQGIPFILAGEEFVRTKIADGSSKEISGGFDHNSYKSSDKVNAVNWNNKTVYNNLFQYYKNLIAFRKSNNAFRLKDTDTVKERITFLKSVKNIVAYTISDGGKQYVVYYNANFHDVSVTLPAGRYEYLINGDIFSGKNRDWKADAGKICGIIILPGSSTVVLYGGEE